MRNHTTSDLTKLEDVGLKRSVKNLIQTNHYERAFSSEIGSDVRALLFENMTSYCIKFRKKSTEVLQNFEQEQR